MRLVRLVAVLVSLLPAVMVGQKRGITEKDLFNFTWIGDFEISPDGKTVVLVETTVAPAHDGYQTALYTLDLTVPGAQPVLLIAGTHDGSPRWSPDGKMVAFTRAAEKEGKPTPPQLYVMGVAPKTSPIKVTDLPKGAGSPQWSPDGLALTVVSSTAKDQVAAKLEAARLARATGDDAHVSDVKIIDRALYRFNGEGLLDASVVPQLYMVYLPKADGTQDAPWQLTGGRFGVQEYVWVKPGWIFYASTHDEEPVYEELPHDAVYGIAVTTGAHGKEMPVAAFTDELKLEARGIAVSPDGGKMAFHASEEKQAISHQQEDLFVQALDWSSGKPVVAGAPKNLTGKLAYEMGSGVGGDNTAPRGGGRAGLSWSADGAKLYDVVGSRGSALLVSVDAATGAVTEMTERKQAVLGFASGLRRDGGDHAETVALISNPVMIDELFRIGAGKAQTKLTGVNDALFSQLNLQMPLDIQVKPTVHAADIGGEMIDTFVQMPPDGPQTNLPMILNIHGGPHSAYGWVFDHEMQWMAAQGYVVVYPNPRGSTTYGQQFANVIMNNYPGDDFHDLMDTVDAVVKLGYADPARLGVTGGSGGGLLTDWVVTQTTRFKAAVAQRDITDWADWWYTADAAGFHQSFYPKSPPFEHIELYRAHSPITFVNNIRTPMMFILGEADYRTPPGAGGEQFFRALKYKKIPTVMVRFPRESHELSRSGEPWHRVERLENIVNWFDLYLKNECEPQYDVAPVEKPTCVAKK
jgi:dipeptidyl aminopeptidase/acylaminoacyl peptidase